MTRAAWLVVAVAACGGGSARPAPIADAAASPAAVLLDVEEQVWRLEGMLVHHVDAALRTADARDAFSDDAKVRSGAAEADLRAFLRASYTPELRAGAAAIVPALDEATRRYLDRLGRIVPLTPEEILLEYLTYDGLFDLAAMRHGYRQWKAGRYDGGAAALADSFFGDAGGEPSASRGIEVVRAERGALLEISVFGGRVLDEIEAVEPDAADDTVVVRWRSNYEQLRASMRGDDAVSDREVLGRNGDGLGVSYRAELGEYLRASTAPWASVLYLVPVDEAADLFAGVASGGDLETTTAPHTDDALGVEGWIGTAEHGVHVRITDVQPVPPVGDVRPKRSQLVAVVVEIESALPTELRLVSGWFSLETPHTVYPELGVLHPELAPELARRFDEAHAIGLPYERLAPGGRTKVALVFDLPPIQQGVLRVGDDELRLTADW